MLGLCCNFGVAARHARRFKCATSSKRRLRELRVEESKERKIAESGARTKCAIASATSTLRRVMQLATARQAAPGSGLRALQLEVLLSVVAGRLRGLPQLSCIAAGGCRQALRTASCQEEVEQVGSGDATLASRDEKGLAGCRFRESRSFSRREPGESLRVSRFRGTSRPRRSLA